MTPAQAFVLAHHRLAAHVARQVHGRLPSHVDADELVSAAYLALCEAAQRYDAEQAAEWTYARRRVHGEIIDELRRADWVPRSVRKQAQRIADARGRLEAALGRAPTRAELAAELGWSPEHLDAIQHDQPHRRRTATARTYETWSSSRPVPGHDDGEPDLLEWQLPAEERDLDAELDRDRLMRRVRHALDRLPPREAEVVRRAYLEGCEKQQIAADLAVSPGRVSQLLRQATCRLRLMVRR